MNKTLNLNDKNIHYILTSYFILAAERVVTSRADDNDNNMCYVKIFDDHRKERFFSTRGTNE